MRALLGAFRQLQRPIEDSDGLPVPSERGVCLARVHQRQDLARSIARLLRRARGEHPAFDRAIEGASLEGSAPRRQVRLDVG